MKIKQSKIGRRKKWIISSPIENASLGPANKTSSLWYGTQSGHYQQNHVVPRHKTIKTLWHQTTYSSLSLSRRGLAPVVQKVDNAIHRIKHYPLAVSYTHLTLPTKLEV